MIGLMLFSCQSTYLEVRARKGNRAGENQSRDFVSCL